MASTLLGGALLLAGPAFAEQPPAAPPVATVPTPPPADEEATVSDLVITGSRIVNNEFNSPSPVQVLTSEQANARGVADAVQFLQSATVAAGSPQNNAIISSAFVTNGGPGSATLSLRGLGANRTLVLLNGRRAGPAGTRGGVSAVDLNVLPQSAIERVDILKDGASSIYGSDAVAGVVNIITKRKPDGGEISAFYTAPEESGGQQMNISANWGKSLNDGHVSFSLDYYKQFMQVNGDREYTRCAEEVIFDRTTGKRADLVDPRTGKFRCGDSPWGQVWVYAYPGFATKAGKFQYDYDGTLGAFIPPVPNSQVANYPKPPPGFYLVGFDRNSNALLNANHPFEDAESLIPENQRVTAYFEASHNLTPDTELYTEILLNRRESRTTGYRQYWTYNYTSNFLDLYYGAPGHGGDPLNQFTGLYLLSPTPVTDHYGAEQNVNYMRGVFGLRGKSNLWGSNPWTWDIYGQYSRSDGDYIQDVILKDALLANEAPIAGNGGTRGTGLCAGTILPVSGKPCMDIDFTNKDILAGNLTQAQRDYLFDVDKGNTKFDQAYIEGFISGTPFDLPAGPLGLALGFNLRHDKIVDTPGPIVLADNSWGLSSAGITTGSDTTREVFTEIQAPLFKDKRFVKNLDLSLSARFTDVKTSGSATTYKAGINWDINDQFKLRGTYGTSFRAPALFELYLANQSSFVSQRSVDPCIGWAAALTAGTISQRLADNCASAAGPGGGVPGAHSGSGSSAQLTVGGGLGQLKPETSSASVIGLVWKPTFADISFAVDYFTINVKDEVTDLGGRVVAACYNSDTFPVDPLCSTFVRNPGTKRIDTINGRFINISEQENEGVDFTIRYRKDTKWGDLIVNTQATYQINDTTALFAGTVVDSLGTNGNPKLVGSQTVSLDRDKWTFYWSTSYVGPQSDRATYGSDTVRLGGVDYLVKVRSEPIFFHTLSAKYDFGDWDLLGGVANIFAEKPPALTTVQSGLGRYSTIGTSSLASQYTEGYYGRRFFLRVSKKL